MCSIAVYTKNDISLKEFERASSLLKYRGPDMTRIVSDKGMWGFNRLSIMGVSEEGMQPFELDGNML